MIRTLAILAALVIAAPATAATYTAKPMAPAGHAKFVGRDIIWTFADGNYRGSTDLSRPLVLCQSLAKHAGRLESFAVDGRAMADAELAKCNAAAPRTAAPALADAK